jgi:nucleotide-binding universal stress UspA family protein
MKVLIGYDGSPYADAAIDDLVRAGLPADTHALVLSVADVWPQMPAMYREAAVGAPLEFSGDVVLAGKELVQHAATEAAELAERARQRLATAFPGWTVEAESVSDSPGSALVERAEAFKADLIVIGSHGRGAIGRLIFGSISQKVVRYAHCSVRIGRHIENRPPGPLRVMVGMDTSEGAAGAISAVAQRAWPAETIVHLVTVADLPLITAIPVIDAPPGEPGTPGVATDPHDFLRDALKASAEELRRTGLGVTTVLREGDPKRALLDEAETWHADCVVLGAKGMTRFERFLLGSVSAAVCARAHCSVEIVRFE